MLTRALIIVGLLAAALVALTLAVVSGRAPLSEADALGTPIVPRPIWETTGLEITPSREGAPTLSLHQRADGRWVLSDDGWPANEPAIRATLRLLSGVKIEGRAASTGDASSHTRVVMRFANDERAAFTLERGEVALGGRSLLANERGAYGSASVELAQALGDIQPDAWRSPEAIPGVEVEASRVSLELADGSSVALARTAGRWRLREPLRARADERRVGALLNAMIDLRVQRFATPDELAAARDRPARSTPLRAIVVETDRRTLAGPDDRVTTTTDTTTLRVIGALGDSGESVVCESEGVAIVLRAEALSNLAMPAEAFLAMSSLGASPSDIGMIALRDADGREGAFRRQVMAWVGMGDAADRLLNPADDPGAIGLVLQFLANAQPVGIAIVTGDPPAHEASVRLYGLADDERGALGIRWEGAPGARSLVVREDTIERRYAESQAPRLLRAWLDAE